MGRHEPQTGAITRDPDADADAATYSLPAMEPCAEPLVWVPFTEADLDVLDRLTRVAAALRESDEPETKEAA